MKGENEVLELDNPDDLGERGHTEVRKKATKKATCLSLK